MTTEYRPIRRELWAAALTQCGDVTPHWNGNPAGSTTDVSEALVTAIVDYIMEGDPFCDHSVGICQCDTRGVVAELKLWLEHKETCPVCHGDGFVYSQEMYDQRAAEATPDEIEGLGEQLGYVACAPTVVIP